MTFKSITPIHDRLIVRRHAAISKIGSIELPKQAQEQQLVGTVLECGDCRIDSNGREWPLRVKRGDIVMFSPFSGTPLPAGNGVIEVTKEEEVLVLREEDVIAILVEDTAPKKADVNSTEPVASC